MDGGELFARIEESQGFCERGGIFKKPLIEQKHIEQTFNRVKVLDSV